MENVLVLAAAATTFAKVAVDIFRMAAAQSLPTWTSPVLALCFGILAAVLLAVADGVLLTQQVWAQTILAGILAAGGAVGVTELSRRAE